MLVGYVRVSTKEQDETNALEQQTARVEKAGAVCIFSDVESGRSDKRKQFNKLLSQCKQGKITGVIVTRIDRLGRSVITIHKTLSLLETYKVKLIVLDAPVDPSSPFGWFSINQMAGLAEFESRLLADRIKHGLDYFREQKKASPRPPFGYIRLEEKYAPNHSLHGDISNWLIARDIVEHFLIGNETLRSTCCYILQTYKISWTAAGLRYWLLNPVLRGHTAYNIKGNLNKPENWTVYEDTHQALISLKEINLIRRKLEVNKNRYSYGNNKIGDEVIPLAGQITCGDCGYKCFCRKSKYSTYRIRCKKHENLGDAFCTNKKSTYLPDIISKVDQVLLTRYEQLRDYSFSSVDNSVKDTPEIEGRKVQLQVLQSMPRTTVIQTAIEQTLLEIDTLRQKLVNEQLVNAELLHILSHCFSSSAYWEDLSWIDRCPIYRDLVAEVVVLNGEILNVTLRL